MDFGKETHELIAKRTGRVWVADLVMYSAMGLVVIAFVAALVRSVLWSNEHLIAPLISRAPTFDWSAVGSSPAVVSLLVTVVLFAVTFALVMRWFRGWERVLKGAIDSYVGSVRDRVKNLEETTASAEWAEQMRIWAESMHKESLQQIIKTNDRLEAIDKRLKKLEPNIYEQFAPPVETASLGGTQSLGSIGRQVTETGKLLAKLLDPQYPPKKEPDKDKT